MCEDQYKKKNIKIPHFFSNKKKIEKKRFRKIQQFIYIFHQKIQMVIVKTLQPEIQFGTQKAPSQDLDKLSAKGSFFKSPTTKAMKLEKEHFDITDGLRAMDNLEGENGEAGLRLLLHLSRRNDGNVPKEHIQVSRGSCAWQRQCREAEGWDGAAWT